MWECVTSVFVPSQTLQSSPDARQSREEADKAQVRGVARGGIGPAAPVQTEEESNITHAVGQRAEHIAEKEVSKFDRKERRQCESSLCRQLVEKI